MNFMPTFNNLERVGAVQKTIPEEFKRYDLFKKSEARVAKLNALNHEPVSGITSMMDFSQDVYDRVTKHSRTMEKLCLRKPVRVEGASLQFERNPERCPGLNADT